MISTEEAVRKSKTDTVYEMWTIQSLRTWDRLQAQGVLRTDGRRIHDRDFMRKPYRWLMSQMKERLPVYRGRYPVWAWYHPKPDLRRSAHAVSGTMNVRLKIRVPASRVLLSDFESWHLVLNNGICSWTEGEDYCVREDIARGDRDKLAALFEEKYKSWERVLDLDANLTRDEEWLGDFYAIQAVMEEVRLDEVVSAQIFKAR